jgi:hypothetical protein
MLGTKFSIAKLAAAVIKGMGPRPLLGHSDPAVLELSSEYRKMLNLDYPDVTFFGLLRHLVSITCKPVSQGFQQRGVALAWLTKAGPLELRCSPGAPHRHPEGAQNEDWLAQAGGGGHEQAVRDRSHWRGFALVGEALDRGLGHEVYQAQPACVSTALVQGGRANAETNTFPDGGAVS